MVELRRMKKNGLSETFRMLGIAGSIGSFAMASIVPVAVCTIFSAWLQDRFELGSWVVLCGIIVGLISGGCGAYRWIVSYMRDDRRKHGADQPRLKPPRNPNEEWHINKSDKTK